VEQVTTDHWVETVEGDPITLRRASHAVALLRQALGPAGQRRQSLIRQRAHYIHGQPKPVPLHRELITIARAALSHLRQVAERLAMAGIPCAFAGPRPCST
jgi:hypothetical protein